MKSKFNEIVNVVLEEASYDNPFTSARQPYESPFEDYSMNDAFQTKPEDKPYKYNDKTIAMTAGSFKPPHKASWERIMALIDDPHNDHVCVVISNLSRKRASENSISKTNLKGFDTIKNIVAKITAINSDMDEVKQLNDIVDEINKLTISNDETQRAPGINFIALTEKLTDMDTAVTAAIANGDESIQKNLTILKSKIEAYKNTLSTNIFRTANKYVSPGNVEITPEKVIEVFKIFAKSYGVEDKVDFIIAKAASPFNSLFSIIEHECYNCNVLIAIKPGDESAVNREKSNLNTTNEIEVVVVPTDDDTHSEDIIKNLDMLNQNDFPEKLTDEEFEQVCAILQA